MTTRQLLNAAGGEQDLNSPLGQFLRRISTTVDALVVAGGALDWKDSVRVATVAAAPANTLTGAPGVGGVLTANAFGALPLVDGVQLVVGNSVLIKNEAAGQNNGIYVVTDLGSAGTPWILTRRQDADTNLEVTAGMLTTVTEGTVNVDTAWWLVTPDPISLNVTSLTFAPFPVIVSNAQAFVFRPTAINHGNVYGTWASLMTAVGKVLDEPKTIWFDDSLAAVAIPVGAYDMGVACSFQGVLTPAPANSASTNRVEVTCPQGVSFSFLQEIKDIRLTYSGTGHLIEVPTDGRIHNFFMRGFARTNSTGAAGAIFGVGTGAIFAATLYDFAAIIVAGGGFFWDVAAGAIEADLNVPSSLIVTSVVPTNSLKQAAGPANVFTASTTNLISLAQASMPGGVIAVSFRINTSDIDYIAKGLTSLANGVSPAIAANISASSSVLVTIEVPSNVALTVNYGVLFADRVNGTPGSFKITALLAGGTINVADTSNVRWAVIGP
jgi:hypothetical protein